MTQTERFWMSTIADIGCIVCRNLGYPDTPGHIHHLMIGTGGSQRNFDLISICLCPHHHQQGGPGQAIHADQPLFERNHGTELHLLQQTISLVLEKLRGIS